MASVILRWAGPSDATTNTDYRIESDKATSGTFATVTTRDATSPYASVTTSLNGAIDAATASIVFADATNFANTNYAVIEKELVYLAGKSSNTFSAALRGQGGTMPTTHATGASVAKAHETYTDSSVTFGSRKCIRYRVIRVETAGESVAAEFLAISPTMPPRTNLCRIYGVLDHIALGTTDPSVGVTVTLAINDSDNFHVDTSETILKTTQTVTTDSDGYFELLIPRNISRAGGDSYTLTIAPGTAAQYVRTITTVPDVNTINYLLTT